MLAAYLPPTASPELVTAAESLIKAACSHAESTSLSLGQDTVAGLKKLSLDSSSIQQSIVDLKSSSDTKTDELILSVNSLKNEIADLNAELAEQSRSQRLEWAIANHTLGSFDCYRIGYRHSTSGEFAKKVLLNFRQGLSANVSGFGIGDWSARIRRQESPGKFAKFKENAEYKFRKAFTAQIRILTGGEPWYELKENEQWHIHYN